MTISRKIEGDNMLDNFQLIPGEAFIAIGSLGEKLIDKLSDAVGFIATPKGNRRNIIEAEQFLIDQIKADDGKPYIQKAAEISNARRLIREYNNQNDIVNIAIQNLGEDAMPENIDVDWLAYFMDQAKNISAEDMQIIWGKILAKECEDDVPKTLINSLSLIGRSEAENFRKLCCFCVECSNKKMPIIFLDELYEIYTSNGLSLDVIYDLQSLGLICTSSVGCVAHFDKYGGEIKYFDKKLAFSGSKKIKTGNVRLTRAGIKLENIVTSEEIDGFWDFIHKSLCRG